MNTNLDFLEKIQKEHLTKTVRNASSLSLDDLIECKQKLERYSRVYFIASKSIPDGCFGIMYVRPEDMPIKDEK